MKVDEGIKLSILDNIILKRFLSDKQKFSTW